MRLWIIFKLSVLGGFPCFLPHYYHMEVEVQVPYLAFFFTLGRKLLISEPSVIPPLLGGLGCLLAAPYAASSETTEKREASLLLGCGERS